MVVLIGPPGAGKSAVGPLVADLLGVPFRDTDADVAQAAGKPVGDIFVEDGEERFRELERAAVTSALGGKAAGAGRGEVLALGSGAVSDEGVRQLLAGLPVVVVYLSASFGTLVKRIGMDRPRVVVPGNPRGRLRAMLNERLPLYQGLAPVTVETDDLDPDELAAQIVAQIRPRSPRAPPGSRRRRDDRDQDRRQPVRRRAAVPGGRRRRRAQRAARPGAWPAPGPWW